MVIQGSSPYPPRWAGLLPRWTWSKLMSTHPGNLLHVVQELVLLLETLMVSFLGLRLSLFSRTQLLWLRLRQQWRGAGSLLKGVSQRSASNLIPGRWCNVLTEILGGGDGIYIPSSVKSRNLEIPLLCPPGGGSIELETKRQIIWRRWHSRGRARKSWNLDPRPLLCMYLTTMAFLAFQDAKDLPYCSVSLTSCFGTSYPVASCAVYVSCISFLSCLIPSFCFYFCVC